jgi:hypothetical protein
VANKGILIAGAAALAYMAFGTKKKKKSSGNGSGNGAGELTDEQEACFEDGADHVRVMPDGEQFCWWPDGRQAYAGDFRKGATVPVYQSAVTAAEALESPEPAVESLYQIRYGDNPIEVARAALFGSRAPVNDPAKQQAIYEYILRIDCSPWNQAFYGRELEDLREDHRGLINQYARMGVSYNPIYANNRARLLSGLAPTSKGGRNFAFIWLPAIDPEAFAQDLTVTVEGQNWPDTEAGMGHSKLDPPGVILDMGDANSDRLGQEIEVGCELPEGDFRKKLIKN